MTRWWIYPLVRAVAALSLPILVPAIITGFIWLLPGDPVSIICPPEQCRGGSFLAESWNLDGGPWQFFTGWFGNAIVGDFGASWRYRQGYEISKLILLALPNSLILLSLSTFFVFVGASIGIRNRPDPKYDPVLFLIGVTPSVVLALLAAAVVDLQYGIDAYEGSAANVRLLAAALTLGIADGALSGAITGVRGIFKRESTQRYVEIAILRGENELPNMLPNVAGTLAGQLRARVLHILSGLVIVEVVVGVQGIGELLWGGTLLQDFGLVLAAATLFALLSSVFLCIQALVEILSMAYIRRAPVMGDA
ncbi:MAG: ABC transporter permease subunit [Myxococcota bacterium]